VDQERREDTVRLLRTLGDAWLLEPDTALLTRLAALPPLGGFAGHGDAEQLAIAYSSLFLQMVPPYASLFLSEDGMLNADPAEEAQRAYTRAGFEVRPAWRAGAADHIGVELHFLATLLERGLPQTQAFLTEHLLTWAPVCCLAVERAEVHPLYTALGRLTCDVVLALGDEVGPNSAEGN
jgi:putative dimethyl sulfoxide reductase chaperone